MDILKEEQRNNMCEKHPTQQILFVNMRNTENMKQDNLYYCDFCLNEDLSLQYIDMISIKRIIDVGDKNINHKWPPVSNYKILQELIQISSQNLDRGAIYKNISNCFTELKEEIMQQLDQLQKKIITKVSDSFGEFDQIFEQYQAISKIDSLRSILLENQKNNMNKKEDLKEFIAKLHSEKGQNTQLLKQLLNKSKQLDRLFSGQYQVDLKDSLIQYFKKFNTLILQGNHKELIIDEQNKYFSDWQQEIQNSFIEINKKAINALIDFSDSRKFEQSFIVQELIASEYGELKDISVVKNEGIISLISKSDDANGQLYSEFKIDQDKIYEFIIGFKSKPLSYICIGFEEEQHKNRYLGEFGKNSFALGVQNTLFCSKLVKGKKNLQALCSDEFVETIVIQVLLCENKFYIADYPQKRAVNCMDDSLYKFQSDKDYYLTIQIYKQNTQVDIISSRILKAFTII